MLVIQPIECKRPNLQIHKNEYNKTCSSAKLHIIHILQVCSKTQRHALEYEQHEGVCRTQQQKYHFQTEKPYYTLYSLHYCQWK